MSTTKQQQQQQQQRVTTINFLFLPDDDFEVIIGSDIIYHPSIIPPLVNVLKHVLTSKRRKREMLHEMDGEVEEAEKPVAYISAAVRKPTTFDYFVLCLKNSR